MTERPQWTYTSIDQLTETLESQGFEWTAGTDNGDYLVTCWRARSQVVGHDQVPPIKFYGTTLNAAFRTARDTLIDGEIVVCHTCGQKTVGVVGVDGYPPGTCPFCFATNQEPTP
jgi:rubrerythrin